jgi:hypothetical protein
MSDTKSIFVGLNETLIYTDLEGKLKDDPGVSKIVINGNVYSVKLRPGASKLLKGLRKKGEVYLLTKTASDYALAMSNKFGFDFDKERIFDRDYIQDWKNKKLDIPIGENYLIDDLPYAYNFKKISFLKQLGVVKYIKVNPYNGSANDDMSSEDVKDILKEI